MALKGNLRDFSVTQLLNLINVAHKTGTLYLEGTSEQAWIYFKEGKLAFARTGQDENQLASVLYRARKLTAAQYRAIQQRAGNISDKELGLLLINAKYLTQQDILSSLQMHFIGVIYRLFTWADGFFRFDNDQLPPDDKISVRVNLENIIIEGSRRTREWEHLVDEIPSLDMALKFTERPGANLRNINLSVDEWRVVSYINPRNTIRQIAKATKKNDLEIRRIVYALLQAGLVDMVRPMGAPVVPAFSRIAIPPAKKEEQKSLINRIINRIRSL